MALGGDRVAALLALVRECVPLCMWALMCAGLVVDALALLDGRCWMVALTVARQALGSLVLPPAGPLAS